MALCSRSARSAAPSPGLLARVAGALLAPAALGAAAAAQSYKLSDVVVRPPLGGVEAHLVAPGGTRVAFLADLSAESERVELFSAPLDASAPPTALFPAAPEGTYSGLALTPAGDRVVFLFTPTGGATRLHSVPLEGGPVATLGPAPAAGGNVQEFRVDPTGTRVVYRADQDADARDELYSVPVAGGAALRLNAALAAGGDVTEFALGSDGAWVAYRADQDVDEQFGVYGVPLDGGSAPVRLDVARSFSDVASFAISFDGLGVVYRADQDVDDLVELWAVPIDGSFAPAKRNGPLVAGGDVRSFVLSAAADRLLYVADQHADDRVELFAVSAIHGGTPVRVNGTLSDGAHVADPRLSDDGEVVVYLADEQSGGLGLYRAPSDGGAPAIELAAGLVAERALQQWMLEPSGAFLVFVTVVDQKRWLHAAPLDGSGAPVLLEGTVVGFGARTLHGVLADGSLLYSSDRESSGLVELYRVPLDGSAAPAKLSGMQEPESGVAGATVAAGGTEVVYHARQEHSAPELYAVPQAGGPTRRLSGAMPLGEPIPSAVDAFSSLGDGSRVAYRVALGATFEYWGVETEGGRSVRLERPSFDSREGGFRVSPDGRWVVYEHLYLAGIELHAARLDVARASRRLDGSFGAIPSTFPHSTTFEISPDSTRVFYLRDGELYSARLDGGEPPQEVWSPPGVVGAFVFTPDGARAVFETAGFMGGHLYSAPVGGGTAVELHAPSQPLRSLGPLAVAPDSGRVVFCGEGDEEDVIELFSVPVDGGGATVRLSGPMVAGGDVVRNASVVAGGDSHSADDSGFRVSPDSSRVVYRADQALDGRVDLWSAPIDGSSPAVRLNGAMAAGGVVVRFEIDASSQRVVYTANEDPGAVELFSVPIDGSAPPLRLNAQLVAGGNVTAPYFHPAFLLGASGRVVYRADQEVDERFELYGVPIDGGAPPVRLSGPLTSGGDAGDFELTVDRARVVFKGDALQDEVFELFVAPLDAAAPARRISGAMVPGGDLVASRSFDVCRDGKRVLYRADQDRDGTPELYACFLERERRFGYGGPPRVH